MKVQNEERSLRIVFCSCPRTETKKLARKVIEERAGACVQILPSIESVYYWKGEICEDEEALLLIKTESGAVQQLIDLLIAHHPYTTPEVMAVGVVEGECTEGYRNWLLEEVGKRQNR